MGLFNNGKILSIDFKNQVIKGVIGRSTKKGIIVDSTFSIDVPEGIYDDGEINDLDQLTYSLRSGLSENGIKQEHTHVVINSTSIVMREVTLPLVSKEEIEAIIAYQLEDYIPINPDDYIVQYIKIGTKFEEGIEKLVLLLVGVPRTIIQSHLTLLSNLNLKPEAMDYHGNAIAKLVSAGGLINNSFDNKMTIACIDLNSRFTELTIVDEGVVRVARVIEKGFESIFDSISNKIPNIDKGSIMKKILEIEDISIKPSQDNPDQVFIETLRDGIYEIFDRSEMIFRYYKTREISNDINLILLYGELSSIKGLDKMLNDFIDTETTVLRSLQNLNSVKDLGLYANAIGGLIRVSEVKK